MTNQNLKLEELQKFIKTENKRLAKFYSSRLDPQKKTLAWTIKLMEELGELCREILTLYDIQRKEKIAIKDDKKIAEELADVIIVTLLLADNIDIDIYKSLEDKIKKIKKRNY